MRSLFVLIDTLLSLYVWLLIGSAVLSWLVAFNVINAHNRGVYMISDFLYRITEPVLRPVRRWLPTLGGIDVSPIVVILAIFFVRNLLREYGLVSF